jgi:hypothetical protein
VQGTSLAAVGHLFVAQGDLTTLACDGLLIPCDSNGHVRRIWESLLPPGLPASRADPEWLALPGRPNEFGVIPLDAVGGRPVWAFVTVDVHSIATPADVVSRTWRAVKHVSEGLAPSRDREVPLLALPLAGTGHAGLATKRARSSTAC